MTKQEFLKAYNLTENQFYGKEKILGHLYLDGLKSIHDGFNPTVGGSLCLDGLKSIPKSFNPTVGGSLFLNGLKSIHDGFNPTVGGSLFLNGLKSIHDGFNPTVGGSLFLNGLKSIHDGFKSIHDGFNPTVGGSLYLNGLTSIHDGFNPTVGGSLCLDGLTSVPKGFNPTVGGSLYLNGLNCNYRTLSENEILFWDSGYLKADGIFSKILSKKGNYYKLQSLKDSEISYLYTDGSYNSHGKNLREAKNNFDFKIRINEIKREKIKSEDLIDVSIYRALTGACEYGVNSWKKENGITQDKIKASELLILLEKTQAYGLNTFKELITRE